MMSYKVTPSDAKEEIRSAFEVFDRDGSGTINASEIGAVMKAIGENLTDAEIQDIIQQADENGDGTIDCEFASLHYLRLERVRL